MTDDQKALDAERRARPDWSDVSRYTDGSKKLRTLIEGLGFTVVPESNGYSVLLKDQVGAYTLTDRGEFRWGWVEVPNGRSDLHNLDDFIAALNRLPKDTP